MAQEECNFSSYVIGFQKKYRQEINWLKSKGFTIIIDSYNFGISFQNEENYDGIKLSVIPPMNDVNQHWSCVMLGYNGCLFRTEANGITPEKAIVKCHMKSQKYFDKLLNNAFKKFINE